MARPIRFLLSALVTCAFAAVLTGCQESTPALPPSVTPPPADSETADAHDHPDHGTRGGHMYDLDDGTKVEIMFADREGENFFTVFADNPDEVTKVEMITTIDGEEKSYEFEKQPTFDSAVFAADDPGLATAAKMGEGVDIKVVITRGDDVQSGTFEHHSH